MAAIRKNDYYYYSSNISKMYILICKEFLPLYYEYSNDDINKESNIWWKLRKCNDITICELFLLIKKMKRFFAFIIDYIKKVIINIRIQW